jgi:plasmid replication initiation protein
MNTIIPRSADGMHDVKVMVPMVSYFLDFRDLEPLLNSSQTVEYYNLEDAVVNVIAAVREIIADHIRHGKVLTMTSVVIKDEAETALAEISVADVVWDLLAGLRAAFTRI